MPNGNQTRSLTVGESLDLAGRNLLSVCNPEDAFLPYWELSCTPEYKGGFQRWWPAHNLGRWWDAMMRLHDTVGIDVPTEVEAAMTRNVERFFDNPDHICLDPNPGPWLNAQDDKPVLQWDLHSLREGMLALLALARWKRMEWPVDKALQLARSVDAKLRNDGTWDLEAFEACKVRGKTVIHNLERCDTHGRLLETLIWMHQESGHPGFHPFIDRIAEYHLSNTLLEDGGSCPGVFIDHTHSYLGTLRGLLLYGRLTKNADISRRVAKALQRVLGALVHESGYTSHNMVVESFGETTSPGDAIQLALWLCEDGDGRFLDDADRLVRSRMLPSQIRDCPPLTPFKTGKADAYRDLEKRILGAYGGCHGRPHSHKLAVTDVTSAGVHTMADVWNHIVVSTPHGLEVWLHLDFEDDRVQIRSLRQANAELVVSPKKDTNLRVRIPTWTPPPSVAIAVDGKPIPVVVSGGSAAIGALRKGQTVIVRYDLPIKTTKETGLGQEYTLKWKGDEVVGVSPNSTFFPFYNDL